MDLQQVRDVFQIIYFIALSVSGPLALISFFQSKKKEQQQREDGTYQSLDEKYLEFQKLCLQHPKLDVFDYSVESERALTADEKKQELIMFTMLASLFERAFLMYKDHVASVRDKQWSGWVEYMRQYGNRKNFREAWAKIGEMFDSDFHKFIDSLLKDCLQASGQSAK